MRPDTGTLVPFALICLTMACTPGPNMINLLSQTGSHGAKAGYITLMGAMSALLLIACAAVFGLTSLLMTIPSLYFAMKFAGSLYLLYLALRTFTGGLDFSKVRASAPSSPARLFGIGFLSNGLNPKMALLYAALLPPFLHPAQGNIMYQTATLAAVQVSIAIVVNSIIIAFAGKLVGAMRARPAVAQGLRMIFAGALGFFALRLATDRR